MPALKPLLQSTTDTFAYITLGDPYSAEPHQRSRNAVHQLNATELPLLEPVTVVNHDGSEIVIDHQNHIVALKDSARRAFKFGYDERNHELNQVGDEEGVWRRQLGSDGRYCDTWVNFATGATWRGTVTVSRSGYSITTEREKVFYQQNGTKLIDHFAEGELFARSKEDKFGNFAIEDLHSRKICYRFVDGRSAVRDLVNNSLLGYDAEGRLAVMRDGAGHRFEFSNYCGDHPYTVVNECGRWDRVAPNTWQNKDTSQVWQGYVKVDRAGIYSYTDLSGRTVTRLIDGTTVDQVGLVTVHCDYEDQRWPAW